MNGIAILPLSVINKQLIGELGILIIIVAAICGVVYVIVKQSGAPAWILNIAWIVLAAVIGVIAVQFLMTL